MPKYKILALVTFVLITGASLSYRKAAADQPEEFANYLRTGNYKLTAVIETPKTGMESWVTHINNSSYYLANGQLVRIDAVSTDTSILFLESGIYILDNEDKTYRLVEGEILYTDIISETVNNRPETSQIYSIFIKSTQWIKYAYYMWESGEVLAFNNIASNNQDVSQLKISMLLSETEPIIEKIILTGADNVQQDVNLSYETISNEEILEAVNLSMYTESVNVK